jgi:hypothetical protein
VAPAGDQETQAAPGARQLAAYALAILGLDVVQRSTVRALLPTGTTKPRGVACLQRWHLGERSGTSKNRTSVTFGKALQEFETNGWIKRIPDAVEVCDRGALLDYALDGQPAVHPDMLDARRALAAVRDDLRELRRTGDLAQVGRRHGEIEALLTLLHASSARRSAA